MYDFDSTIGIKSTSVGIGKKIDSRARKFLRKRKLDYAHGTGHGVGFFLNVHEGPQSISKFNKIKIKEGMILSNEPGYYLKNKFGIRIENLVFIKKENKKKIFQNLTLVPIEKELINNKILTNFERDYLFKYHLDVYSKISKYLTSPELKKPIRSDIFSSHFFSPTMATLSKSLACFASNFTSK